MMLCVAVQLNCLQLHLVQKKVKVATVIKIKKQFGLGNMLFCIHTKNTQSIQDTTEQK